MAKKKDENASLFEASASTSEVSALTASPTLALGVVPDADELAGLGLDMEELDNDGLGEIGSEDFRISGKVWNFKGTVKGSDGRDMSIRADQFYDTLTESVADQLDLAFVDLTKGHAWTEFDDATQKTTRRCTSIDRVVGRPDDALIQELKLGVPVRPCHGCPDMVWRTVNGKRMKRCGLVYTVLAVDRPTNTPCVLRFKKSSLPVIQTYLSKYHLARRVVAGKRANYPLFTFQVTARLAMVGSGQIKYAVPELIRGATLGVAEIRFHAETARGWRSFMMEKVQAIADAAETIAKEPEEPGGGGNAASFNSEEFSDADPAATAPVAAPERQGKMF